MQVQIPLALTLDFSGPWLHNPRYTTFQFWEPWGVCHIMTMVKVAYLTRLQLRKTTLKSCDTHKASREPQESLLSL